MRVGSREVFGRPRIVQAYNGRYSRGTKHEVDARQRLWSAAGKSKSNRYIVAFRSTPGHLDIHGILIARLLQCGLC